MSDLQLAIKLTTQGGNIVVKDLQQIKQATEQVNHDLQGTLPAGRAAQQGFNSASTGAQQLNQHARSTSSELKQMILHAHAMVAGYLGINSVLGAIKRTDSFNVLTQRIKTATAATGDFVEVNQALFTITQDNRANLESTVEMFQRMATARKELEATNAQMLAFTDAIQELGVIGGTSTENIKAGQVQLAQMLSGNVARAEEFNSILENTPEVAQRIAKGLGLSIGQLRELMLKGKLLSKDVFNAILSQTSQIHQDFGQIDVSIASAGQSAENSLNSALARLDEVTHTTSTFAELLLNISQTLDNMDAAELQSAAAAMSAIATSAVVYGLLAKLNVNLFTLGIAATTASKGIYQKIAAMRTSTVTTNVYGQVIASNTAKLTAATIATRALTVATRTLLGPVGLAISAAYLLYETLAPEKINKTSGATDDLAKKNQKLAQAIDEVNKASSAPVQSIDIHLQKAYEKQAQLIVQIKTMSDNLETVNQAYGQTSTYAQDYNKTLIENQAQLSNVQRFIASLIIAQQQLNAAKKAEQQAEIDDKSGAIKKLAQLKQQVALFGELSDSKKLAYQLEFGSLKGISAELAIQLKLETAKLAQLKKQQQVKANHQKDTAFIRDLVVELDLTRRTAKEKALLNNLRKLSADATEAERAQVVALTEALVEQQQWQSDSDYYDQLITGANDIGEAWSLAGNVIIDTFGSIGQQLNKLANQQAKYAEQQKKIAADKIKYQDDPKKLAKIGKAEEQLAYTRTSANLSSYAAISGAASKMFAENSKGRKALHAMETVFTVAEVALAMQRAAANAIAAITNQGNGDPYTAFARIAAMTALMAGLGIAVSGGGSGTPPVSAEQRQQNQGTGTVLGSDDKSQSIINAFERIEDLELDQYGELRQMNTSLRDLNNNISRLAVSLIGGYGKFNEQSYTGQLGTSGQLDVSNWLLGSVGWIDDLTGGLLGGIISGFKKTKKTLIDSGISIVSQTFGSILESGLVNARAYYDIKTKKSSWWGLSSSTKYSTEYQGIDSQIKREFALIFTNIGDSINQAVSLLGLDVTRSLDNFIINLGEISFKDMSGDDIQKELEAIFSQQADLMAQYLVPGIGEFQQAGEGLYETLLRVAQEQVVFNQVLELTSQSLNGIDPYQQIQVAQSIIEFAGSIEALQSAANTYLNEFFTDAEQFAFNQQQLNEQFAALNTSLPSTRDGFKTLLSSLDLTNEADQRLYAALMLLVPQLDSYYDALEQQGKQAEDAAKKERELAIARGEFVESFAEQLARLDMTPLETKLADLTQQFDDYRKQAEELGADTSLLEQLYARKRQAIIDDALAEVNNTYQRELDKLTSTHQRAVDDLVSNNERLAASISTISNNIGNNILALKRSMAGWDEIDYQRGNISNLRGQLGVGSIEQQLGTIDALNTALWDKYQAELDHNRSMSELAQQRYQDDLANYENLTEAAKSLKQAADDLRFGELSIYSTTEQFGFAKSSFEQALASGDLTKLQDAGKQYLEQAKTYYGGTASSEYQAIFERVTNAFGSASAGSAPSIPAEIQQYQQADLALQTELLAELESLQAMTDALNAERTEQFNNDFASLTEAYNDGVAALDTTLAEQTSALTDGFNAVVEAVNALPPIKPTVVTPPPDLPPFEIISMPVEPPIGIGHSTKNDDMAYITPVKPTPGETALAGSRQLDELVALTRAQNARLEALEMRQAEQNSRNNTRRYIA